MDTPSTHESFIAKLPKVELHVHLEGSVQPNTLRELSRRKGRLEKETEDWITERARQSYRYGNLPNFLAAFKHLTLLLDSPDDYALATTRLLECFAAQNVRYAEITLSAGVILWKKQPLGAVFEAISTAASEAQKGLGLRVQWIFDAVRQFGTEHASEVLCWAGQLRSQGVVAFGIGGDEIQGPPEWFTEIYREARDLGLRTTAHAGESGGAESVRKAVELLGAERIGHGLAAARDPEVLALLRERGVPLEVCVTSNVATGILDRPEDHPLLLFLKEGVVITLNSDDPALFGTSLEHEFVLAAQHFGLSCRQIRALCENAIRSAFLSAQEQRTLLGELSRVGD